MADMDTPIDTPDDLARSCEMFLHRVLLDLNDISRNAGGITDPIILAELLVGLRDAKQDADRAYKEIEQFLLAGMGDRKIEVPGLGVVESHRKTKRTAWKWDELVPVVVARALDERTIDEETGETEREAVAVARAMRECLSFSQGKVSGLRARGIQVDEFCEETVEGWQIQLPPRTAA